jgi:hypothetical protein
MSTLAGNERTGNFGKLLNNTGMLLKTKDCFGTSPRKAGMSMKTKGLSRFSGNVSENKGLVNSE